MRQPRPRLRAVAALLLLWQLSAGVALAGVSSLSMMSTAHAAPAAAHAHCQGEQAADPSPVAPAAPDCCHSQGDCHCSCDLGTAILSLAAPPRSTTPDLTRLPDLRTPADARRVAEVFRPPI